MKVAYLTTCYPAVSHTFIMREVAALRERGVEVVTFSVRRAGRHDIIDQEAQREAALTRWLVPPPFRSLLVAMVWTLVTRPLQALRTLRTAVLKREMMLRQRLLWFFYFMEAVQLAHVLSREGFDRIHCHFGNNGASAGMLAAMLAGIPFSMTCHGSELLKPVEQRLADKVAYASFVTCVSYYGRAQLMLACPPEHWEKLHIVRCGLPRIHGPGASGANQVPRVLCVGRLSREKGHLILLEALARLRVSGCAAEATFIGEGPMRAAIEARVRELKLSHVVTLTGSLAPEAVSEHYRGADVVVLPSFSEGVPVVLMEAMAHGLPVVATRVGGIPELVEHGVSGLLVAPGNAEELAAGLRRVLEDREFAAGLGRSAVTAVQREFLLGPAADRLVSLFRQTGASSPNPRTLPDVQIPIAGNQCLETS